jgi:ribosomal-protein-alanine N-acetyltransferase
MNPWFNSMTSFLRNFPPASSVPILQADSVYLRMPQFNDYADWAVVREESRDFLEPWEPTWSSDALTRAAFRRRLRRYAREVREDSGIAFFIFRKEDDALLGGITLSHIRRGVTQSCSVGYWMGSRYTRQGYMSDALSTVVRFVFEGLRLHRLEAACVPTNEPSKAVLRRCGFAEEGAAREYLCINGVWRDHILFATLSSDERSGASTQPAELAKTA